MKPLKERYKRLYAVALTTLFLVSLLYLSDTGSLIAALRQADPVLLLAGFTAANTPLLVYALVWREVLDISGIETGYFTSLRVVLGNTFVNNVTPFGNIGGEAAATYYLSKLTGGEKGRIFSAVLVASAVNFIPLLTYLVVGGTFSGYSAVLVLPLLLVSSYLLVSRASVLPEISSAGLPVPERFLSRIKGFYFDLVSSLEDMRGSWRSFLPLLVLTHLAALFDIFSIYLIALSLGLELQALELFFVVPLARAANYAPTPGGTGPYEIALSGLLMYFFQVPLQEAVLVVVIYRGFTYYFGLLGGYLAINSLGLSGRNLFNSSNG